MGTRGKEIVGMDVEELLALLNRAFADEWFAYYQYWLGAKVVRGPMKDAVAAELLQHATEELLNPDMVANRIIQLGGKPVVEPKKWYDWPGCGYAPPLTASGTTTAAAKAVRPPTRWSTGRTC